MNRPKVDHAHIEAVLNDAVADAMDELCEEYGIDMIEWYYPFDADAESSFTDFAEAVANSIEQTVSWYTDDEE